MDKDIKLPDGRKITLNKERFIAGEMLFNPAVAGPEYAHFDTLPKLVLKSIKSCSEDVKRDLYSNVILSGGATLFEGFMTRT